MKSPKQIADSLGIDGECEYIPTVDDTIRAIEMDRAQIRKALAQPMAVPGFRPFPLATVDALIDAYEAFDGNDVSVFVDAWNDYTVGLDFPCPEHPAGLHQVASGSCDLCGDKNRGCGTENKPPLLHGLAAESPDRWQNGDCGAYAVALRSKFPHLKFGTLGEYVEDGKYFEESHYFVHDDAFAYDSLGAHPMPYRGIDNDLDAEYDQESWDYDEPYPEDLAAAEAHIRVHSIGPRLRDAKQRS